ncbi:MAG: GH36-type glycosyl hydrolase domain-containing protein [Christensenellales bacterium]
MLFEGKQEKRDNGAVLFYQNDPQRYARWLSEKACKTVRWIPVSTVRLTEARNTLTSAYRISQKEVFEGDASLSFSWLLDNFYLLEGTIDRLALSLKKRYFQKITVIEGVPRPYFLATALVEFTQGRLEEAVMESFLAAYCQERPLRMREIWAMPQMLETALIHFGASVASDMIKQYKQRNDAEKAVRQIINEPKKRKELIEQVVKSNLLCEPSFLEKLIRLSREENWEKELIVQVKEVLWRKGLQMERVIHQAHSLQSRQQLYWSSIITSLRDLASIDWSFLFEKLSTVHKALLQDEVYASMDFTSRQYYRDGIEAMADAIGADETLIALRAMECAKRGLSQRRSHVGCYIVSEGKQELYATFGTKFRMHKRSEKTYIGFNAILAAVFLAPAVCTSIIFSGGTTQMILAGSAAMLLGFVPALSAAKQVIDRIFGRFVKPRYLPRLEVADDLAGNETLLVLPVLLSGVNAVKETLEKLEIHSIANRQNLSFAILGDFREGAKETQESDELIYKTALAGIEQLNQKYGGNRFYLFLRKRTWYPPEKKFMAYERKRGALMQMNRMLLHGDTSAFFAVWPRVPSDIKYVITLDADTRTPIGTAKKLIGTMAHPLNRPQWNENGEIVGGYAILQPVITPSVADADKSGFSLIFSGQSGIDMYAFAISDVYMDLFGEAIYTGKGIYDLKAFDIALRDVLPQGRILSHDLIEGCHARTGLVSDVQLVDSCPTGYLAWAHRQHRWVRGDWQLLPFLRKRVIGPAGMRTNTIGALGKWKIFDNLRRSVTAPCVFLLFLAGISFLPGPAWPYLLLGSFALFTHLILDFLSKLWTYLTGRNLRANFSDMMFESRSAFYQTVLSVVFLAYEAFLMTDAVARTLWRLFVSKRNLIQWVTAADNAQKYTGRMMEPWRPMMPVIPLSMLFILFCAVFKVQYILPAALFSIIWLSSPFIAGYLSVLNKPPAVQKEDRRVLKEHARRIWAYFEDHMNEANHYLAPDNVQEMPRKGEARRTSPTNMAYSVISSLCAYHMGFLGVTELLDRVAKTFDTLDTLEKWNGFFYNWYSTETLEILRPPYISSVDNGNLAGYLLAVAQGVKRAAEKPVITNERLEGLLVTLGLSKDEETKQMLPVAKEAFHSFCEGNLGKLIRCLKNIASYSFLNPWGEKTSRMAQGILDDLEAYIGFMPYELLDIQDEEDKNEQVKQWLGLSLHDIASGKCFEKADEVTHDEIRETALLMAETAVKLSRETAKRAEDYVNGMDFSLLYNKKISLLSIGLDMDQNKLNCSHYDLLASEARQTSFIAIAKGDVEPKHWSKLNRPLALSGDDRFLLSWTGTMFEYFMPQILLKSFGHTLIQETLESIAVVQRRYGEQQGVPWGISESGYYLFDRELNYQYKAFGVLKAGLKATLENELVVSPYATFLALPTIPREAIKNLDALKKAGAMGKYGFYEAVDFTAWRMPGRKKSMVVKSYMAHHKGMELCSVDNYLNGSLLKDLFHATPMIRAAELLLQEKVPPKSIVIKDYLPLQKYRNAAMRAQLPARSIVGFDPLSQPQTQLLSNGNYNIMINDRGEGYSRYNGLAINRWRKQGYYGGFVYMKDINTGRTWSAAYAPIGVIPRYYHVRFDAHQAVFERQDAGIKTRMEVCISPEKDVELRRITLKNNNRFQVDIDVAFYMECSLCRQEADIAHRAFSGLFLEAEQRENILIVRRRPGGQEKSVCVALATNRDGVQYATERIKLQGRNRCLDDPALLESPFSFSKEPLDAALCAKARVSLSGGMEETILFAVAAGQECSEVFETAQEFCGEEAAQRTFDMAWCCAQAEMHFQKISAKEENSFQHMAARVIYPEYNKPEENSGAATGVQELWKFGVSGDLPIVLLHLGTNEDIKELKTALKMQRFWRMKGLLADLVILNAEEMDYYLSVQEKAQELAQLHEGVHIIRVSLYQPEELKALYYHAAWIWENRNQISIPKAMTAPPAMQKKKQAVLQVLKSEGDFENGFGCFLPQEYEIFMQPEKSTPLPWSHVMANPAFGTLVTESGGGFTWADNSHENQITPWHNDIVGDRQSETIYIKDEETKEIWRIASDDAGQARLVRYGCGYAVYESADHGLRQKATVFVHKDKKLKIYKINLENPSGKRQLSVTLKCDMVLGAVGEKRKAAVSFDERSGILYAHRADKEGLAFLSVPADQNVEYTSQSWAFDQEGCPSGLQNDWLDEETGSGKTCMAIKTKLFLSGRKEREVVFLLGYGTERAEIEETVKEFSIPKMADQALCDVRDQWSGLLGAVRVETPDQSFDIMMNQWLLYQTVSARLWARTGYYQCGGAYGFRDQLQDCLSLMYTRPGLVRQHILLCAQHQFEEGDAQHWWHPPALGVRTHISDDKLFLPYVACVYCERTGDFDVWQEEAHYITGPQAEEGDLYFEAMPSKLRESLYRHCLRAINHVQLGERGLPLIGGGDWNDGMNRVGMEGKGESVWLAFFYYDILIKFQNVAFALGDEQNAQELNERARLLAASIDQNAWDGEWYTRAFFDDGTPIGSAKSPECSIDSVSQSWSVISGAAPYGKGLKAMASSLRLVDREAGVVRLLAPAFDKWKDPGYIKGYVPGLRENGGQYTHGSIWAVIAWTKLGQGDTAYELFSMLNPINHTNTPLEVMRYKAEPYVIAADVYHSTEHTGRGGWTWYTGSAAWMYVAGLEHILGIQKAGGQLRVSPCIPSHWKNFSVTIRQEGGHLLAIRVENPQGVCKGVREIYVNGERVQKIMLDGGNLDIQVIMGLEEVDM